MNQPLNFRFVIAIGFIYLVYTTVSAQPLAPPPSLPSQGMINKTLIRAELQFLSSEWFEGPLLLFLYRIPSRLS
jgi:hypothetical protein